MNIRVLYEDPHLLLVEKLQGVPSQPDPSGQPDLLSHLFDKYPYIGLVHRLDTPTGGVMLFSKKQAMTGKLSVLVQDHTAFVKEYLAVTSKPLDAPEGELCDLLFHDNRTNKTFVVDQPRKGAKEAKLTYRTVETLPDGHTLLAVRLYTGRTHQIRAQLAARGCPLVGDGKYGSREKIPFIALWSHRVTFTHPVTGKAITAVSRPSSDTAPWNEFSIDAKE